MTIPPKEHPTKRTFPVVETIIRRYHANYFVQQLCTICNIYPWKIKRKLDLTEQRQCVVINKVNQYRVWECDYNHWYSIWYYISNDKLLTIRTTMIEYFYCLMNLLFFNFFWNFIIKWKLKWKHLSVGEVPSIFL